MCLCHALSGFTVDHRQQLCEGPRLPFGCAAAPTRGIPEVRLMLAVDMQSIFSDVSGCDHSVDLTRCELRVNSFPTLTDISWSS
jgi:hypothetical protein